MSIKLSPTHVVIVHDAVQARLDALSAQADASSDSNYTRIDLFALQSALKALQSKSYKFRVDGDLSEVSKILQLLCLEKVPFLNFNIYPLDVLGNMAVEIETHLDPYALAAGLAEIGCHTAAQTLKASDDFDGIPDSFYLKEAEELVDREESIYYRLNRSGVFSQGQELRGFVEAIVEWIAKDSKHNATAKLLQVTEMFGAIAYFLAQNTIVPPSSIPSMVQRSANLARIEQENIEHAVINFLLDPTGRRLPLAWQLSKMQYTLGAIADVVTGE